ncbi:Coenzyme F420-reducing hydrogenase, beta subunit [Archaeoglobus sulfaticallidus PM70-1]|uniref:Coenzyme F420-reducing hydrogenase, beta subunit n=1 Tax=Archaeoglobus sulfaticallidus PM70-1 TaxID=387631 RepID=N0BHB9_9EURY|nr:Coenzyme F420 hydrogenase/dehydrogenase, beta subunit C-terminal domain [Archaeoglobus sulfaticallidus]AGK61712.1 Coenzyme F420-reducing hydrogenase, beta subunit [Archaeoglobus sulfaticallidus PM70-1]
MVSSLEWEVSVPEKVFEGTYWINLKKRVIERGLCSHCSTCAAICPVEGIISGDQEIDFPDWEERCVDCSACVRVCPRWNYEPKCDIGEYIELTAARSKRFKGQDGAMATEFMASALEMGLIDRTLFVGRDEEWRTKVYHIRSVDQLKDTKLTGTKYSFASVLPELKKAVMKSKKGVGVVGTPCMVSGIRKLQSEINLFREKVKLICGLFCTENFYHHQLHAYLIEKGVDFSKLIKTDITKGKFIATMTDSVVSFPVKELNEIVPHGCEVCIDFTAVESDFSVGSVGSDAGFSTVVVRTETAKSVLEFIKENDYADFGKVIMDIITKLSNLKKKRKKNIPEEFRNACME